ncbi:MAG: ABC transporter ATP-binding protein [Parachlamydiales bacterium]|jgi:lipoprotein-releasing system ATP-binding protein
MHKIILRTEGLFKNYGEISILKNLHFQLHVNEAIAILGASGEGKTTLLHLLGALEKPSKGRVFYLQDELNAKNARHFRLKHFGFIFQFFNLLEELTALENVLMPFYILKRKKKHFEPTALKLLAEVGLEHLSRKSVKHFSGGEKQRVAIARAFCNDPEIIFADEPSGNLDHQNSKKIGGLLLDFVKKKKKSLVLVTHNQELADLCDKRYLLKDGILELLP